jgi:hypothetical protein
MFLQQVMTSIQDSHLTDPHLRLALQVIGISYLILSTRSTRRMLARQEARIKAAMPKAVEDSHFSVVHEIELNNYRVSDRAYDVPKTFPADLEEYVGVPSIAQQARWILEVEAEQDEARMLEIKRVITACAAIHGVPIPKILRFIDDRTKALWVRLRFDMELKDVTEAYVRDRLSSVDLMTRYTVEQIGEFLDIMPDVGELILQHSSKNDFPAFSVFVRNLTTTHDLLKDSITSGDIQSIVTAYAVKTGFKIPASYIRCDMLALQLAAMKYTAKH